MAKPLHFLIALPTMGQVMKSATAITIAKVAVALESQGIRISLHNIDSAEIVTARDMFANMVLHSDLWTHLLFIDSDMHFDARLVSRLASHGGEVVAAAYTRRGLDLELLVQTAQSSGSLEIATAHASEFTFKPNWDETVDNVRIENGFCLGAAVGMGCALIARSALEKMVDSKIVKRRLDLDAGPDRPCYSFFDLVTIDGVRVGEDYSFCYRWTALMKQQLWVCVDEAIGHIGNFEFRARFIDRLDLHE